MFQLTESCEVRVASVTNRTEIHGDEKAPAVSIGIEIEAPNTLLDLIDPKIREALYKPVDDQPDLPGVEKSTPVLRCNSFERHTLPTAHEGWSLSVDDGIDDSQPLKFGGVKCDKFSVEAKQGGTILLRLRLGTSDVDADKLGKLAMHNGQSIWITLIAPKPGDEPKAKPKQPDATDLFAGDEEDADGQQDLEECLEGALGAADVETKPGDPEHVAWPFPDKPNNSLEAPPQSVTVERSQPGTRTARGREQTKAALAAGAPKPIAKYAAYHRFGTGRWDGFLDAVRDLESRLRAPAVET